MSDQTCRLCRWFRDGATCVRFPQHVLVNPDHTCGEWSLPPGYVGSADKHEAPSNQDG
jgi:hypothetical protein